MTFLLTIEISPLRFRYSALSRDTLLVITLQKKKKYKVLILLVRRSLHINYLFFNLKKNKMRISDHCLEVERKEVQKD